MTIRALDAVEHWRATAAPRMLEYFDAPSLLCCGRAFRRSRGPRAPPFCSSRNWHRKTIPNWTLAGADRRLRRRCADDSWFALSAADRERFRRFRHALPELVNDTVRRAGALKMNTDYAVPLARNREMLAYYRRRLEEEFPGRYVIFGHIGDAHVHVNLFSSPDESGTRHRLAAGIRAARR